MSNIIFLGTIMDEFNNLKSVHRDCRDKMDNDLSIRLHRSISWLGRAEKEKIDPDAAFIFYWISFNAAYAGQLSEGERRNETSYFYEFFEKITKNDVKKEIYSLVWQRFSQEVKGILKNKYIFSAFWKQENLDKTVDWLTSFDASIKKVNYAIQTENTNIILSILFSRIYVLRNQIFHGGATWNSSVNREQVNDCCKLLSNLMPILIKVMMDSPKEKWGILHFPVKGS